jgi:glycosyltransferase involved in cell wall biosynthesis
LILQVVGSVGDQSGEFWLMLFPTFSIITVTVQPVSDLEKTAKSILAQIGSRSSFEWIIVVGKYFDEYKDFVKSLPDEISVKLYYQAPNGIYSAMNLGLENSSGEWIWLINCGDHFMSSDALNVVDKIRTENPTISLIASPVLYVTSLSDWFDVSWPKVVGGPNGPEAHFHHQGVVLKKIVADKVVGGFDTTLKFAADGKFLDRALNYANVLIINTILVVFVMGGASSKNFRRVVHETQSYRAGTELNLSLVVKNYARELILVILGHKYLTHLIRPLVRVKSWKVKKVVVARANYRE